MSFFSFLCYKSWKSGGYFIFTAYLNLDFSSGTLDLSLDFKKYTAAKVDSHSQVVSNTFMFSTNWIKDQFLNSNQPKWTEGKN